MGFVLLLDLLNPGPRCGCSRSSDAAVLGLRPGDKIFLLGREIKLVFSRFASLDHPGVDSYDVACSSHLPTRRQPRQEL